MKTDIQKRWVGPLFVALILALGAAFSIYTALPQESAPVPLAVVSERVIMQDPYASDLAWGAIGTALSSNGRYLLWLRSESVEFKDANGSPQKEGVEQPYLLDVGSGEQIRLPFPPTLNLTLSMFWIGEGFTSDGYHVYSLHRAGKNEDPSRPRVLLYDVRNRTLRTLRVGHRYGSVSDDPDGKLLISTDGLGAVVPGSSKVVAVPFDGGPAEEYPIKGVTVGASRLRRAFVLQFTGQAHDVLSVADIVGRKTLKRFDVDKLFIFMRPWQTGIGPFQTADDRFFCYGEMHEHRNLLPVVRNRIAAWLPCVGRSADSEEDTTCLSCFWDSATDRFSTLRGSVPIAPGPTPGSVFLIKMGESGFDYEPLPWADLRVLDLTTGRQYVPPDRPEAALLAAFGPRAVYSIPGKHGATNIVLVEFALPGGSK